jgi:hypothetical protein
MTPFEILIKSWEDKAKHWRSVAKQQRSECRGQTKMRLLEKAQVAEDCANELKALVASNALAGHYQSGGGELRGKNPTHALLDDISAPHSGNQSPELVGHVKEQCQEFVRKQNEEHVRVSCERVNSNGAEMLKDLDQRAPLGIFEVDLDERLEKYAGQTRQVLGRTEVIPLTGETVREFVERKRSEYAAAGDDLAKPVLDQPMPDPPSRVTP